MDIARIRRRVEYLCSEPCAGREAGSPEGAAARAFILAELRAAGYAPTVQPVPVCRGANVLAHLGDPASGRAILLAAHYDHIGRAMPPEVYWGADDNAAAVAIVLELADHFAERYRDEGPPRPIIFALFDGEEPPFFLSEGMGSIHYVEQPSTDLEAIDMAIVLDLVGHALGSSDTPAPVRDSLFCLGAEKSLGTSARVDAAAASNRLHLRKLDLDLVPPLSDYEPFRRQGVPVLFLSAGRWRHYHEVTDTPDRLDYPRIADTAAFTAALVSELAQAATSPGRYQPDARDHGVSAASLRAMCQALAPASASAAAAVDRLDEIASKVDEEGRLDPSSWSELRQILALLEQGLA